MTAASANFGPLTTTFTPLPDCFTEQWIRHNTNSTVLAWGPTCDGGKIGYASSCYPTGWSGSKSDDSNLNYKGFSPGLICPYGFTASFSASHIHQTKSFLLSEYLTSLGKDDIASVCCPSNYSFNGDLCTSNAYTLAARPILTVTNSQCTTMTAADYNGGIGTKGKSGDATFQAMPVILIRNTISDAIPSSTSSSSSDNSGSGGLSTGAKIAIGVCVPVAIIIAAAIAFVLWHRRRKRARGAGAGSESVLQNPTEPDPYHGKPELDGGVTTMRRSQEKLEMDAGEQGVWKDPGLAELPEVAPVELPAQQSPTSPQELAGDVNGIGAVSKAGSPTTGGKISEKADGELEPPKDSHTDGHD
ncbi:uncharacterized protein N7503_001516 [Penicillium pulvis]|uniref:uncharacterized protein n=1 Tax=Penicillium pulvis TaxID=1562058 RepID=UPI0025466AD6|nr:uncharacterized protein N7503_001516 [Penicillium pulvis]KAJ5809298.1 hypothetical protein N7503_001516 [Penicillium pulvis]